VRQYRFGDFIFAPNLAGFDQSEGARALLLEVKRVALQCVKRDHCERLLVSRRQYQGRRDTGFERFAPGGGADAPPITGLQPGKSELERGSD